MKKKPLTKKKRALARVGSAHGSVHLVTADRRELDGTIYGYHCTCGSWWKIYQNEYHAGLKRHEWPHITYAKEMNDVRESFVKRGLCPNCNGRNAPVRKMKFLGHFDTIVGWQCDECKNVYVRPSPNR